MKTKFLLLSLVVLAACATVEGAGKDIETGGKAISNAARDVGDKL